MDSLHEDKHILEAREKEFCHAKGVTYLDHAGATLYSTTQLQSYLTDLSTNLYGNPHSQNPSSKLSSDVIEQTRLKVLEHFNTDLSHYDVVFTSGCTGALKLLCESFPWEGKRDTVARNEEAITRESMQNASVDDDCKRKPLSNVNMDNIVHEPIDNIVPLSANGDTFVDSTQQNTSTTVLYLPDLVSKVKSLGQPFPTAAAGNFESNEEGFPLVTSVFCYLEDNHTSVVGMREEAAHFGAQIVCATEKNLKTSVEYLSSRSLDAGDRTGKVGVQASSHSEIKSLSAPKMKISARDNLPCTATDLSPPYHLFVYPAQSNFSGQKYPLTWISDIPDGHLTLEGLSTLSGSWLVALDAASFVSTSRLDLLSYPAHFVAISFYKMFGFPTGLGALLVRRDCSQLLEKTYYGGGTVSATVSRERFHLPRPQLHERFEDGTVPFLSIVALSYGFETLYRIGKSMDDISQRTFKLARYVYKCLSELRHGNGRKACIIYCQTGFKNRFIQGPIVNFNLVRPDGRAVGYSEVDKLACVYNIHIRTGCFCNTGACMSHLGITAKGVRDHIQAGHVCGDSLDVIDGRPTGSVRVSFGYMSTVQDAQTFIRFIEDCFIDLTCSSQSRDKVISSAGDKGHAPQHTGSDISRSPRPRSCDPLTPSPSLDPTCTLPLDIQNGVQQQRMVGSIWLSVGDCVEASCGDDHFTQAGQLEQLTLYPIKSCSGQMVTRWLLGHTGLLHDREWMVVSEHGSVLSQKQEGKLCLIQPTVDLERHSLTLTARGHPSLTLPLGSLDNDLCPPPLRAVQTTASATVNTRVCGDRIQSLDCGEKAANWLNKVLNRKCRLVKQNPDIERSSKRKPHKTNSEKDIPLSLANEAQYLLISRRSVEELCSAVHRRTRESGKEITLDTDELITRFRPNFVVTCNHASSSNIPNGHSPFDHTPSIQPYCEEKWECLRIMKSDFTVSGQCSRCQMICVDQVSGERSAEPLKTLMELRGSKVPFGIYLSRPVSGYKAAGSVL